LEHPFLDQLAVLVHGVSDQEEAAVPPSILLREPPKLLVVSAVGQDEHSIDELSFDLVIEVLEQVVPEELLAVGLALLPQVSIHLFLVLEPLLLLWVRHLSRQRVALAPHGQILLLFEELFELSSGALPLHFELLFLVVLDRPFEGSSSLPLELGAALSHFVPIWGLQQLIFKHSLILELLEVVVRFEETGNVVGINLNFFLFLHLSHDIELEVQLLLSALHHHLNRVVQLFQLLGLDLLELVLARVIFVPGGLGEIFRVKIFLVFFIKFIFLVLVVAALEVKGRVGIGEDLFDFH